MKTYDASLSTISILIYGISRSFYFVNEIRVEYVELVPLNNLWRWVVVIIVSLVVFVPLVSSVNTVEVLWLPWAVLVMPPVHLYPHQCNL